jgi:hypothetical protein
MNANDFLSLMEQPPGKEISLRFGYIDSAYTSGRPKIKFDGQDTAGAKTYPYLASYTPVANDRIMILQNVVIGKIL